ncbi:hypothetical protein LCGC14_1646420 [marine sediment metagenome]|uniref:Uncharacterized protein n=1 Tax=marine sediment metagenome TaxID=412755 RepID=A0A0F9HYU2_9ZZZZ
MNKKEFNTLLKEATKEFKEEKRERFKKFLKERMQEYEMAKSTVTRLDKQFKRIQKEGFNEESFLLEYDERD